MLRSQTFSGVLAALLCSLACAAASANGCTPGNRSSTVNSFPSLNRIYTHNFTRFTQAKKSMYRQCIAMNASLPAEHRMMELSSLAERDARPRTFMCAFIQLVLLAHEDPFGAVDSLVRKHGCVALEVLNACFAGADSLPLGKINTSNWLDIPARSQERLESNIAGAYKNLQNYLYCGLKSAIDKDPGVFIESVMHRYSPDEILFYILRKANGDCPALQSLYGQVLEHLICRDNLSEGRQLYANRFMAVVLGQYTLLERIDPLKRLEDITIENIAGITHSRFFDAFADRYFCASVNRKVIDYIETSDSENISPYFVANFLYRCVTFFEMTAQELNFVVEQYLSKQAEKRLGAIYKDESLLVALFCSALLRLLNQMCSHAPAQPHLADCTHTFIHQLSFQSCINALNLAEERGNQALLTYIAEHRQLIYAAWKVCSEMHD
ncbi:hypothetical protein PAPHI01_1685 [Pancytospora philotis]|nr:hypothetical protein PAPHI01_1685 [Pancytospora philotis]